MPARKATTKTGFTPFPAADPPYTPNGQVYRCTGCGGVIRDGMLVFRTVRDGMVVGLKAMPGVGPGVPASHECGDTTEPAEPE